MMRFCVLVGVGVLLAQVAFGTDRIYRDLSSKSPSGQFKVKATSPDNHNGKFAVFQADFEFTLRDLKTNQVLWTRKQRDKEPSPVGLHVSDGGYTVIVDGWNQVATIGLDGKESQRLDLLEDVMDQRDVKRFVRGSSAGPLWREHSLWHFVKSENDGFFVIRPWWGNHMVVELTSGKSVQVTQELSELIDEHEKQIVIQALASVDKESLKKNPDDFDVHRAVYLAGKLQVSEAIAKLRIIQRFDHSDCSTFGGGLGDFGKYETYSLRLLAQLSLRRLGETPERLPPYRFFDVKEDARGATVVQATDRRRNAERLKPMMTVQEVVDLMGVPDFIGSSKWVYDLDGLPQSSVSVTWDYNAGCVQSIQRQRPPEWKTGLR